MIGVVGASSKIAEQFMALVNEGCRGMRLREPPEDCRRFLVCNGLLLGHAIGGMMPDRIYATLAANFVEIAQWCDDLFASREDARVCVIGSESGFSGSYDMAYAGSKAALHLYVETKRLKPAQQLVAIAPSIIGDAGMTTRRVDTDTLNERLREHPKGRFVTAAEVASLAAWLLGPDGEYVSGTVVRMHGGGR